MGGPLVSCGATSGQAHRLRGEESRRRGVSLSHRKARCVFPGLFPQAEGRKLGEVLHVRPQGCGSGRNSRRGYTPPRGRVRHAESQDGPRRDAQGRRDHGCRRRRSGPDRRGSGRVRRNGARARSGGHSPRRWRGPDERPAADSRDPGGSLDPGDGEVPHWALRGGADPAGARDRLHRRVGGLDPGRHRASRRQVGVHCSFRLRCDESRRSAPPDLGRRRDDPDERRGGYRRHRQRGHAHARRLRRHSEPAGTSRPTSCTRRRRSIERRSSSSSGSPRTAACRS